jgi:5-methylcytosine-specific restriction enzyme A
MPEKRRYLSKADKSAVRLRQDFHCACGCGKPLTGAIEYDHELALDLGGTNDLSNFRALMADCHREKSKADAKLIAKGRRIRRKAAGTFNVNRKRLVSRGFQKSFRRKMDGSVVERTGAARMA